MFDYPLSKARNTLYHELGIMPEATEADIRDAKKDIVDSLNFREKKLNNKLKKVHKEIPDLQSVAREVEGLKKQQEEDTPEKLRISLNKLSELEAEASKIEPEFKEIKEQLEEIRMKRNEMSIMRLENPGEREKYDQKTPPCALLKLANPQFPLFTDKKVIQVLIRNEIALFLGEKTGCYHPSDFTRKDFSPDFTLNEYLDKK